MKGDIILGGGEAYRIVDYDDKNRNVKIIQVAGQSGNEIKTNEVPKSFFTGKTVYRAIANLSDIDVNLAVTEISSFVDISELGCNPRLWVAAFLKRYEGEVVPDSTVLLGWFARLVSCGEEKVKNEIEEEARLKKLEEEKKKKLEARKKRALKKKNDAKAAPKLRTRKGRAVS